MNAQAQINYQPEVEWVEIRGASRGTAYSGPQKLDTKKG